MSSEIKWSEPMTPVIGVPRPQVYQVKWGNACWSDGEGKGLPWNHGHVGCRFRVPVETPNPAPSTIPHLPYLVTKCERQISDLRANQFGDDDTHANRAEELKTEMQAAIRECADRLTAALVKSKE